MKSKILKVAFCLMCCLSNYEIGWSQIGTEQPVSMKLPETEIRLKATNSTVQNVSEKSKSNTKRC